MRSFGVATSWLAASVAAAALIAVPTAKAQEDFPTKPVEMTILFGGTAQTIGQLLADLMSKELGQPVVPVSRTGGGGAIGYSHVHSTRPDGYNIVWNSNSISSGYHQGNLPFNYEAFEPIARVTVEVPALAVRADSGWESLSDMVEAVKSGETKLKMGASGQGSFTDLTAKALFQELGIEDKVVYVPYGDGKAPVELLAGRVDAAIQWPGQFIPHVQSGDLKMLCVTGSERVEVIDDVPTCAEAGAGDLDITMWRGLAAPEGTPQEVVEKLQEAARKAAESDQLKDASGKLGFEISFMDAQEFGELIAKDDEVIAELLKSGN
ncbi:Bug family tripartite tricarboxylate transporter substrate binding protein [Lutibaculum baratangense]|nr:tripartite tricarboxylate transporter substrate binding protein [Lutibaculum baratangense]